MECKMIISSLCVALCLVLVGADVQSDVQRQIDAGAAKINQGLANVQTSINNAPRGTGVSVACIADSAGNSNCDKNVSSSSSSNGSGSVPAVQVHTEERQVSPAGPSSTQTVVKIQNGASSSFLLSSTVLMVVLAFVSRNIV